MYNTACLTHHDESMPNLVCSHYLRFRNFQERTEKYTLLQYYHFSCSYFPGAAPVIICHGDFQESFRKRASHNRSSLPKRDATRERLDISFPEGILLTTHDHALLTKNFRALAPVKNNKSFLKSARSAHTTELATCNAHANLRRPARPPGFLNDFRKKNQNLVSRVHWKTTENLDNALWATLESWGFFGLV